jgi:hypothetical protein
VEIVIDSPADSLTVKEPRRSEFVKTDDPKVLERINDLYGQVKKSDARNQMIIEHNKQLEARLAEYADKVNKIERSTQDTVINKVEADLKQALRAAREEGDYDNVDEIENKLLDIRLERRLAEKIPPKETPKFQQVSPQQQQYEQQLINNATYIENLALEKNQQGNLLRPYLYDWHPDNKKAVELFESIPKEFAAAGKQVEMRTIMEVLDERLQGRKTKSQSAVLSGDNSDAPARNVVRLSAQEIDTAKKMGIRPEDYARQKQLLSS